MREATVRRLLNALLMLYPGSFRWDVGEDLVETALHRWRDARRSRGGEIRFWLTEGFRFGMDGVIERLRSVPPALSPLRHAGRQLVRKPGQQFVAIATLALGIGATTTIFTVADAIVFRPLPYEHADELHLVHTRIGGMELSSNSLPNLLDLQLSVKTMQLAGAFDHSPALTDRAHGPERVSALDVTANYLPGLGARVQIGRAFQPADHAANAERVVIVAHSLWQRRWGGDRAILGSTVQLDGVGYTVIGVMEPSFRDPAPIESGALTGTWVPVRAGDRGFMQRDYYAFQLLGRLQPTASIESARAELTAAARRLSAAYPDANRVGDNDLDFALHRLHDLTVGDARERVLLLLGAVVLLLVLSCANVANLFLARGVTRAADLSVRAAIGATRTRLALQLFGESLLTASLAGLAGGGLAVIGLRVFVAAAPSEIPRLHEINVDAHALFAVFLLTLITAVVFGSVPAVRGSRAAWALAAGARTTTPRAAQRFQSTLVALEIALSLILVSGSALLLNSFRHILQADPGFQGDDVAVVDVRPPTDTRSHMEELQFYRTLMERLKSAPGVERVALIRTVPGLASGGWTPVTVDDHAASMGQGPSRAPARGFKPGNDMYRLNTIDGDLFAVLDMPLLAGTGFTGDPRKTDPPVVVLNQAAARHFFPKVERPIGRRIALAGGDAKAPLREVVGIVGDVLQQGPGHDAEPQIYTPYGQQDADRMSVLMELQPGATLPVDEIRRLVREVAPDLPVDRVEALSARYAATTEQTRFLTLLLSVFAALGLLLAVAGTYATAAHALSTRTRELGIRIALGARTGMLFRLVLNRALAIVAIGIVAGLVATWPLTHFLDSHIFGITSHDPATLAMGAALIAVCAVLASLGPAVRAVRVNPNDVLRIG